VLVIVPTPKGIGVGGNHINLIPALTDQLFQTAPIILMNKFRGEEGDKGGGGVAIWHQKGFCFSFGFIRTRVKRINRSLV
jgi:hypothetical protein